MSKISYTVAFKNGVHKSVRAIEYSSTFILLFLPLVFYFLNKTLNIQTFFHLFIRLFVHTFVHSLHLSLFMLSVFYWVACAGCDRPNCSYLELGVLNNVFLNKIIIILHRNIYPVTSKVSLSSSSSYFVIAGTGEIPSRISFFALNLQTDGHFSPIEKKYYVSHKLYDIFKEICLSLVVNKVDYFVWCICILQ